MRVGTICYATDSGLGILAKSFYDAGVVDTAVVVAHGTHPDHLEWYPGSYVCRNVRELHTYVDWLADLDVLLCFETPFNWQLVRVCRELGVKTVLMPMHECFHEREGMKLENKFDLYLCPSLLEVQQRFNDTPVQKKYLPIPVQVPWRLRTKVEVFVHNAGHGGLKGRNGTRELIESVQHLKSDAEIVIRSQDPNFATGQSPWKGITFSCGTMPYDQLWTEGDVFVFPERFNGLSLPLQEARASGMLVMTTDRFPNNTYLPTDPLIPVKEYKRNRIGPPYREFDEAVVDPRSIAAKIDEWFNVDITDFSLGGREWAQQMSWSMLAPQYTCVLEELCKS